MNKKARMPIPNVIPRLVGDKQMGSITFDPNTWRITHITTRCPHLNWFVYINLQRLSDAQYRSIQAEVYQFLHSMGFKRGEMPPIGWNKLKKQAKSL